jgi:hypothetical protein
MGETHGQTAYGVKFVVGKVGEATGIRTLWPGDGHIVLVLGLGFVTLCIALVIRAVWRSIPDFFQRSITASCQAYQPAGLAARTSSTKRCKCS